LAFERASSAAGAAPSSNLDRAKTSARFRLLRRTTASSSSANYYPVSRARGQNERSDKSLDHLMTGVFRELILEHLTRAPRRPRRLGSQFTPAL
jgi:hypothetical protein